MIKTNHKNIRSTTSVSFSVLLAAHSYFYGILTRVRQSAPPDECVNFKRGENIRYKEQLQRRPHQLRAVSPVTSVVATLKRWNTFSCNQNIRYSSTRHCSVPAFLPAQGGRTACRWSLHKNEQRTYKLYSQSHSRRY